MECLAAWSGRADGDWCQVELVSRGQPTGVHVAPAAQKFVSSLDMTAFQSLVQCGLKRVHELAWRSSGRIWGRRSRPFVEQLHEPGRVVVFRRGNYGRTNAFAGWRIHDVYLRRSVDGGEKWKSGWIKANMGS